MEIYRNIGNKFGESNELGRIGRICFKKGNLDRSIDLLKQGLEIARLHKYKSDELKHLINISNIFIEMFDVDQALKYLNQALDVSRSIGHNYEEIASIVNIGRCHMQKCDYKKAISYLYEAQEISIFNPGNDFHNTILDIIMMCISRLDLAKQS